MIHQRGMTLIEVLIAGIILFIAIAALSFVARVQVEHQIRFEKTIEQAYLSEFLVDKVKYHLNYTEQQSGTIDYRGQLFEWRAKILKQKSVVMGGSPEDNFDQGRGVAQLYSVDISRVEHNKSVKVLNFTQLVWKPVG